MPFPDKWITLIILKQTSSKNICLSHQYPTYILKKHKFNRASGLSILKMTLSPKLFAHSILFYISIRESGINTNGKMRGTQFLPLFAIYPTKKPVWQLITTQVYCFLLFKKHFPLTCTETYRYNKTYKRCFPVKCQKVIVGHSVWLVVNLQLLINVGSIDKKLAHLRLRDEGISPHPFLYNFHGAIRHLGICMPLQHIIQYFSKFYQLYFTGFKNSYTK